MKIGHGPATVIARRWQAERRESGTCTSRVNAGALREKERGELPHGFSWGFFIVREMRRAKTQMGCALAALILSLLGPANRQTQGKLARAQQSAMKKQDEMQLPRRTVTDEAGRKIELPVNVRRIVTLTPNLAEIIYALGAQDRLVGVSEFSDRPAAAQDKPSIGMPVNPSLEAIVGARPDVVLATAVNTWATVDSLARLGIPVFTTDPHTVGDMLRSITGIGNAIGAQEQAHVLVQALQARLDALQEKLAATSPVSALFVVWEQPLISIGKQTFIADALRAAGGKSAIDTKQDWPQVSLEEIVKINPDYIIYADANPVASEDSAKLANVAEAISRHLKALRADPVWRSLPAVREGRIAVVSDEIDLPAPGLVGVIEQLAQELHPAIFSGKKQSSSQRWSSTVEFALSFVPPFQHIFRETPSCAR